MILVCFPKSGVNVAFCVYVFVFLQRIRLPTYCAQFFGHVEVSEFPVHSI